MTTAQAPLVLEVMTDGPGQLDAQLNAAVDEALEMALEGKQFGILVTRHDDTKFTVTVSHEVPFGQTIERSAGPSI
ncbi:hypothetical protein [Pseudarthrobacter albicanus]|uniref:hypothetical protein n=1 Tax=Pseudarthrobacter TaxID=1742993 RepID=UPI001FE24483|nr:hypothetical protein [Pseudarthrobacter albicanus]